jgi:hypothetical protein
MTYRVKPSGNQWVVTYYGATKSNHRLKRRAKQKARELADAGDNVVIHDSDGQFQNELEVRS